MELGGFEPADLLGAIRGGRERGRREKGLITSMFAELTATPAIRGCAAISGGSAAFWIYGPSLHDGRSPGAPWLVDPRR